MDTAGIAIVPSIVHPPSGPISTVRVPEHETVLTGEGLVKPKVFSLEAASLEPTEAENRIGRAARLFWLWFAANASLLSIGLGAAVFGLGMSLRQSIVATLAGVALSFFPLGLSTLAGKRSGQPTMVVSRATFGLVGNVLPSILSLISRLFWGAVLLWFLATATSSVLIGAEADGGVGERTLQLIFFGVGLVLAFAIALFGYGLLAKVQLVLSIVSGILVVGMIAMTANYISFQQALSTCEDGPWILVVTGAVLVFSFVGLALGEQRRRSGQVSAGGQLGRRLDALGDVRGDAARVHPHRLRRVAGRIQPGHRERLHHGTAGDAGPHAALVVPDPGAALCGSEPAVGHLDHDVLGWLLAAGRGRPRLPADRGGYRRCAARRDHRCPATRRSAVRSRSCSGTPRRRSPCPSRRGPGSSRRSS